MSEIEFIKKRDQQKGKETVKDEDKDKAAFPVSAEKTRPWGMESLPSPPLPSPPPAFPLVWLARFAIDWLSFDWLLFDDW